MDKCSKCSDWITRKNWWSRYWT